MDAYSKSKTKKSDKDYWCTPWWLMRCLEDLLGITFSVDVCATAESSKVKGLFWNESRNALSFDWVEALRTSSYFRDLPVAFMNPPYSELRAWTKKASFEALKGMIVVGVVPHMPSSANWFPRFVHRECCTIYMPDGRITFERPDGRPVSGNPIPTCIPVWTPWRPDGGAQYCYFERNMEHYKNASSVHQPGD